MNKEEIKVLSLDMEGTLVSTFKGVQVRPHLYDLLTFAYQRFERVVLYTRLSKETALQVVAQIVEASLAPKEFIDRFEYIDGPPGQKDLTAIPLVSPSEVLMVDDSPGNMVKSQKNQWIIIPSFNPYFSAFGQVQEDIELKKLVQLLHNRLEKS